jgi:hypothetical protein
MICIHSDASSKIFETAITPEHTVWTRHLSYRSGGQRLTTFEWIASENLQQKQHIKRSRKVIAFPKTLETTTVKFAPEAKHLPVNESLMKLLGWYIAEGYLSQTPSRGYHRTTFCLGHSNRELQYGEEIVESASALGLHAKLYHPKIGIRITIDNVVLARWLMSQFGTGSVAKCIPLWVRTLPTNLLEVLLDAWARGDGWTHLKRGSMTTKITTVSPQLIVGLREIALKCGYDCSINRHKENPLIMGRTVKTHPSYTAIFHKKSEEIKKATTSDENYLYTRTSAGNVFQYHGKVFNLEVDEDNSYCTASFAVHNCVVPQKEGIIKPWQKPDKFHDERFDTCMIMDNNLFGAPLSWQDSVFSWFSKNNIKMLSPQGWDARLLNQHRCEMLASVKHVDGRLHFAWDNMQDESAVRTAIGLLEKNGFNLRRNVSFYVLCGYNTTFEQDLYRCVKLKDMGVRAYAMRYTQTPALNALARWTALPQLFWKIGFEEYTRDKKKWENRGAHSDGNH